jgi:PelA/Pel-15E family pectate lyase
VRRAVRYLSWPVSLVCLAIACARSPGSVGTRVENDTASLLSAARIARLPPADAERWHAFVARSDRQRRLDQDSMARELKRVGRERMTRAPDTRRSFSVQDAERAAVRLADDSLRAFVATVLSFQTPSGGWSKHVDYQKGPRRTGESYFSETDRWQYIPTLDNDATIAQLRLLAGADARVHDDRWRDAFRRGVDYLFAAQMPNGCWAQVFPLQGGYHDAVTFNDDAIVNVLRFLRTAVDSTLWGRDRIIAARARYALGIGCILRSQVRVAGRPTVWAQQHDPLTLAPLAGRSYELPGLSGRESASIMRLLMDVESPSDSVVAAVHAAAAWFEAHEIRGFEYVPPKGLVASAEAEPLWARLTDLETDRPIFANRDGVKLYDYAALTDRRIGYGWFTRDPAAALKQYERWSRAHAPREPE